MLNLPACTPIDAADLADFAPSRLVESYRTMVLIREVENAIADLVAAREIACPCHLYAGQEAVAAAVCAHLTPADHVYSTHRSHGHFLAKGGGLQALISEVFCREEGASHGRGGSMHLCDPQIGFPGSSAIVAGTIPLAVGSALAFAVRREPHVAVAFFGDGATSEGAFYEAINFAALRRLPVLFVCENNFYSTHMPIREIHSETQLHKKAEAFAVPARQVDGYNFGQVSRAAAEAVARARAGDGPTFLECLTYRYRGHVGPNTDVDKGLRAAEELKAWQDNCAVATLRDHLLATGGLTPQAADALDAEVRQDVLDAVERARRAPSPRPETLCQHLYKGRA